MGLIIARRRQFNNRSNDPYGITLVDLFLRLEHEENDFGFSFSFFSMCIERKLGRRIVEIVVRLRFLNERIQWLELLVDEGISSIFYCRLIEMEWSNGRIKMLLRWNFDVWILIVWVFVKGLDLVDLFGIWIWWKMEYEAMVYEFNGNLMEKCSLLNWKRIYLIKYIKIYG